MHATTLLLALGLATAGSTQAGLAQTGSTQTGSALASSATDDLSALAWMAGHWIAEHDGKVSEELWLAPRGGVMPGLARTSATDRARFEYLRIEQRPGALVYVASPGGAAPTEFTAVEVGPAAVRFENPAHDFPTWIRYEATGEGLRACIGAADPGQQRCWQWQRAGADAAP